jgi:hypothetical protein
MNRTPLFILALALALSTGCKHQEEAAKKTGADMAAQTVTQPIDKAHDVANLAEKTAPVVLDTTAMIYHKPGCKYADAATAETTTLGAAEARGAKPDPVCFPAK